MGLSDSFERAVRHNTDSIDWTQHQTVLQMRPHNTPNAIHHEHYRCGDEISVSTRLVHNVLHVLTAVSKELNQGVGWSDSNSSVQGVAGARHVPDFIALANGKELRMVGEAKTPLTNDLVQAVNQVTSRAQIWQRLGEPYTLPPPSKRSLNQYNFLIGQVAKYMKEYYTKYGFFTTYDYTIFLKQERRDDNWVLWHSRPIACGVQCSFPNPPGDLAGGVSVRECFFYLQTEIWRGHWYAENRSNLWVSNKMAGNVDYQIYFKNDLPALSQAQVTK
jgi:hypothetical protein